MTAVAAVLVAAAASLAGGLVLLVARLDGDPLLGGPGGALTAYGLVVLPVSTLPGLGGGTPSSGWVGVAVGTGLVVAAAPLLAAGSQRRTTLLATGTALVGIAHAVGAAVSAGPLDPAAPSVAALRTVAVAIALGAAVDLGRRALGRLDTARDAHEEGLLLAELRLGRTAERDHELRGGLAGLAGALRMLGRDPEDREHLNGLVSAELTRLHELLDTSAVPHEPARTAYDVEPVLSGLVALRRVSGLDVELAAEPGLRVIGAPATLAQVVTNLLGNAERHAPGSPVRITAVRSRDRIVVGVRDFGPGVLPGREEVVFERGVRSPGRGGRGLGLSVCRALLAAEDGAVAVVPAGPSTWGCTVLVGLAAAASTERPTCGPVSAGVPCPTP